MLRLFVLVLGFLTSHIALGASDSYRVVRGETLGSISTRSGVAIAAILHANPSIKHPDRIAAGDVIMIPRPVASTPSSKTPESPSSPAWTVAKAILSLFGASFAFSVLRGRAKSTRRPSSYPTSTSLDSLHRYDRPDAPKTFAPPPQDDEIAPRPVATMFAHQRRYLQHGDGTNEIVETTIKITRSIQ